MEELWPKSEGLASGSTKRNKLTAVAVRDIGAALTALIADFFALYLKTKNFHWHVSGSHFRDYHLLLEEHAAQILTAIDLLATQVRKLGATTLRSVSHVARLQRILDNDADYVEPREMMAELREDNLQIAERLHQARELCKDEGDLASASLIDKCTDEAGGRAWVLLSVTQDGNDE